MNVITGMPGMKAFATGMMKSMFSKKGVATIKELLDVAMELEVRLIACQMTMDVFGFSRDEFIDGIDLGGAATFLEFAAESDISLFI